LLLGKATIPRRDLHPLKLANIITAHGRSFFYNMSSPNKELRPL
jgi:hypothetical protein